MMLILDWFAREGLILLSWWGLVTLVGVAALPLCMRLLVGLPDKGYTLSRSVGLLLVGFVFWLLAVLGFVRNEPSSLILAWGIVLVIGWVVYTTYHHEPFSLRVWWAENRSVVIVGELLFALLLTSWVIFRAYYPNLTGTEKPMELAFMSAIQRSEVFPPNDPWMSGYAISYYHFGYVLSAGLATLSGINTAVGFNMTIALLFALTGLNTFGVVYNLVRAHAGHHGRRLAVGVGILGMVFVVLLSNFQFPLIELPYQNGTVSQPYLEFWDAQDRVQPPPINPARSDASDLLGLRLSDPTRWDFWWWFRASRVINDRHLPAAVNGEMIAQPVGANVIDEFPQFSFLLADVHPHVLALPFAVLALGLALNILLTWARPRLPEILLYGVVMGGLMFLNMWDGPIYMVVLVGAEGLRRLMRNGGYKLKRDDWLMLVVFLLSLISLTMVLYLPFFISFRSQASGIIPNVEFPTLFRQYFLMFGPFILLITPYLIYEAWHNRKVMNWRVGLMATLTLSGSLLFLLAFLVLAGWMVPAYRETVLRFIADRGGLASALPLILSKRLTHSVTTLVLLGILTIIIARLFRRGAGASTAEHDLLGRDYAPATGFALFMVACAAGITLVPEFIYLRDNFGVRINTIFKFYYQAWVMFSVGAAYAVYAMLSGLDRSTRPIIPVRLLYAVLLIVVLGLGLLYPAFGIHNRMLIESNRVNEPGKLLTLDGGSSLVSDDDYAAITCLAGIVKGDDVVVAEAIGPSYRNQFGRVAVLTGIPIVLGWEGHERQWRGATYPAIAGTRRTDIERLYNDPRWDIAVEVIRAYSIDYVFYGTTERRGTGEVPPFSVAGEDKFIENLEVVCQRGESLFYRVTPRSLELVGGNS